jgi:hypothetical protein
MTSQQIGKLWTVISAVLLYYALNSWLVTQGGNEIFGMKLIVMSRIPAAMIAIPVCSILLLICSLIGRAYSRRTGPKWHDRIPVVGFDSIDTGSSEGKIYQGAMIILLSILPALSLMHFWRLFATARVVTTTDPAQPIESIWSWSALTSLDDPARICTEYRVSPVVSCDGNASVLPGLEPTVFAVLTAAALLAMALHWLILFSQHSPNRQSTLRPGS